MFCAIVDARKTLLYRYITEEIEESQLDKIGSKDNEVPDMISMSVMNEKVHLQIRSRSAISLILTICIIRRRIILLLLLSVLTFLIISILLVVRLRILILPLSIRLLTMMLRTLTSRV